METKKTLFILGDSISIHYTPFLKKLLDENFYLLTKDGENEALRNLDIMAGANGGDSSNVLRFLEYEFENGNITYDYILLNCGLHDIKTDPVTNNKQVDLATYQSNLKKIIDLLDKCNVKIFWVKITPVDDETHNSRNKEFNRYNKDVIEYNNAADEIMQKNNIPMVDLYSFTHILGKNAFCDHVHFIEDVRLQQATFISEFLLSKSL